MKLCRHCNTPNLNFQNTPEHLDICHNGMQKADFDHWLHLYAQQNFTIQPIRLGNKQTLIEHVLPGESFIENNKIHVCISNNNDTIITFTLGDNQTKEEQYVRKILIQTLKPGCDVNSVDPKDWDIHHYRSDRLVRVI